MPFGIIQSADNAIAHSVIIWYVSIRVGVAAAKAAGMKVVAVPSIVTQANSYSADCVLHSLLEFRPESWGLPEFKDCISLFNFSLALLPQLSSQGALFVFFSGEQNALPIEPMYVEGLLRGEPHDRLMILDLNAG